MSDRLAPESERAAREPGDDDFRRLFQDAGRRPSVPEADLAAIRAAFQAEWERSRARPRRWFEPPPHQRAVWVLAAAAAVLLALAAGLWWWSARGSRLPAALAHVEAVSGPVVLSDGASGAAVSAGTSITVDAWLETAAAAAERPGGRAALRLSSGASLRVDAGSRIRLRAPDRVELVRGAVYVDSESNAEALAVETTFATVRDIGTQFEVRIVAASGAMLRVRVRAGGVSVEPQRGAAGALSIRAGEEVVLGDAGRVERSFVACRDPAWSWAQELAAPFALEGRSARELLDWLARETCWQVRYADPDAEAVANRATFAGPSAAAAADESATRWLSAARLAARVEDGTLVVSRSAAPRP